MSNADPLLARVPPQDLEAERSILGSCLLDSNVIDDVLRVVRPESFYTDAHQKIFAAIVSMHMAGEKGIDVVTLGHELQRCDELEDVGGLIYLVQIIETVPHAAHAEYYSRIVRDSHHARAVIDVATDALRMVLQDRRSAEEVIPDIESRLHRILESGHCGEAIPLSESLAEFADWFESDDPPGIPTGFDDLDEMIGGLRGGREYVIAARPSMGKTAFAVNVAVNLARSNASVCIFSKEQSRLELTQRIVASLAGVDLLEISNKRRTQQQRSAIIEASKRAEALPLRIRDVGLQTVVSIAATLRPLVRRGQADVAIVDYLQLLDVDDPRMPREQQVAAISRTLKGIATDLDIPVIVLAQLNRMVEQRDNKRPRLADLRESGAIEQDADVVLFLHRECAYDETADPHDTDLIVAKNRNGPTGGLKLHWHRKTVTFRSAAGTQHQEGPQ